ncbi:protein MpCupin102 [Marchantia polymorpha subsp. ruderalis]|uniref:Germin-like protein n=2 Tax=Marchantia polymorpha TaxID=3197 RepID=A0A176VD92_MARPO|nr:hypothetical protein AXG93_2556s1160 [Marchantia polymorpha subsp. ruderalis]PTQ34115.1 hypothetical protein MARPO_0083s0073 [Marchantia polymorpha]BBN19652.1 hypothetical protein Mp_8g12470 [Marchantia polymorpha subsp. ruderalis]|eukprot:PTQ34115.1 hypothetical protein MARPO_0083s0073 [Marchantia polymorpha]
MKTCNLALIVLVLACCRTVTIDKVAAADPDPLTDVSPNANDFVIRSVFKNADVSSGSGGQRAALSTSKFPAIESQGITVVQFNMTPCGLNRPHTHPRATEILSMLSGVPLQAGFVDTAGKAWIELLYPGDIIVFPRGLLHYELNVGKKTAFYLSALNSQNPGTLEAAGALLSIPDRAAATTLNQNLKNYGQIKKQSLPYDEPATLRLASDCVPGRDVTTDF